jgi:CHAD domain-containing protein
MLKKAQQKKYFNDEWESMRTHLLNYYAAQDPEALHRFRVQVKKIKAMLLFWQDNPASAQLKSLQSVFLHAGLIRSAAIHLQLFDRYQLSNPDFQEEQENIVVRETRRFYQKQDAYIRTLKKIQSVLAGGFRDLNNKVILKLYKKQLKKLSRFFARRDHRMDQIHQKRKKIKNLLYLYNALPESVVNKLQLNTTYLDQLQNAIGKWHDVAVIVELLKTEGVKNKNAIVTLDKQSRRVYNAVRALSAGFKDKVVA